MKESAQRLKKNPDGGHGHATEASPLCIFVQRKDSFSLMEDTPLNLIENFSLAASISVIADFLQDILPTIYD